LTRFGTPQEIYGSPVNEFAADFIGAANIIHGELIEGPDAHGRARVWTPLEELRAIQKWRQDHIGKEILVAFRPEEVSILTDAGP